MAFKFNIPENFEPVDEVLFCSNRITNTKFLIDDNGFYPILLGKGESPRVWLYAQENRNRIIPIVEDNEAKLSKVKFDHYLKNKRISISIAGEDEDYLILDIHYNDITEVVKVDLRPLGYNIVGNKSHLDIGGIELKNNNFNNMNSAIGLGNEKEKEKAF